MISDYTYNINSAAGAPAGAAAARPAGKVSKGLKRLFIIAGVIFAAELIWLFGVSPFIPFSVMEVHSFDALDRGEVLRIAGLDDMSSFFSVNANEINEKVSSHILVESARVFKRFPDKLSIFLTPRQPVAVSLTEINSKPALVYVDRRGVFFKAENSISGDDISLPVISGIDNPKVGMSFPDALVSLTESLAVIGASSPELLASISEIRIERKTWEGYELVIFPAHTAIKARMENNLTEEALRYMLLMLNVFNADLEKPDEVDFRSGVGSYKAGERPL